MFEGLDVRGWMAVVLAAVSGRMMAHARAVQDGHRRFWGQHLLWEMPIAIGMAYIAAGAGEWLGVTDNPLLAVVAAASYLGPASVDALLMRILERRA